MPRLEDRTNAAPALPGPVTMVRESREPYPFFALPKDYSITWYQPGHETWWYDIQRQSDPFTVITRETFTKYFGEAPQELPARQCFLLSREGAPVGTATAWFDKQYRGQEWGRLHWVAILPEWQGRGLGRPLLSVVCARLRALHPDRAYLRTAPQRLAAIHLYFTFGFVPEIRTREDAQSWERIHEELKLPKQAESIAKPSA